VAQREETAVTDLGPELLDWIDGLFQIDDDWRVREARSLTCWPFRFRQQITADVPRTSFGEETTRLTISSTPLERGGSTVAGSRGTGWLLRGRRARTLARSR
jgi:hypothetical protein